MNKAEFQFLLGKLYLRGFSTLRPKAAGMWFAEKFLTPIRPKLGMSAQALADSGENIRLLDGDINAYRWGDGHKRALLVHGFSGNFSQLRSFIPPLLGADWQVVAIDLPAHGQSTGKETNPDATSLIMPRLLEELGGVDAIIAHSFGAASSLLAVAAGMPLAKLVTIGSPSYYPYKDVAKFFGIQSERGLDAFRSAIVERANINPDIKVDVLPDGFSTKVLIAHDKQDVEVPFFHSERLHALLPDSVHRVTDGLGHRKICRDADIVDAAISFILEA